ncbi:MAG: hypothetical protein HZB53_08565 [Chloroflexi bacterium]|nr:hypothetical protein [Chloroflexota bacterium]
MRPAFVLMIALLLAACGPLAPMPSSLSVPTATLVLATATSAPPTPTSAPTATPSPTPTATLPPTATPSPSATPTAVPPISTPTLEPTATPQPTATRAPTRPPTDTPVPVAAAPAPACPAWYQPPQPGKGLLVIANGMKIPAWFEGLPGRTTALRLDATKTGDPIRYALQMEPGQYEISYSSEAGGRSVAVIIGDGDRQLLQVFLRASGKELDSWWRPVTAFSADAYLNRFDIPYGCPGGLPPTPTPPPQCPAWYATPAPDKAVLAIENRSTESFDLLAPNTGQVVAKVPRNANELPGFVAISLSPGHYEFLTSTSKRVVVDLAPGTSAVVVHPESRWGPDLLQVYGLTPPTACPGYTPPTPPPPPQCPAWFQRPQPGKGVLIVENYVSQQAITVVGLQGIVLDHMLLPARDGKIDRLVLQLSPGHYEFGTIQGGFTVDVAEGQVYGIGLTWGLWGKRAATVYMPPGCP